MITALAPDSARSWRAVYGWPDDDADGGFRVEKFAVLGWAARGDAVLPVRVEARSGRGVLVGSDLDPWVDWLLAVLTAGQDWQQIDGVDSRVRAMIVAHVESKTDAN